MKRFAGRAAYPGIAIACLLAVLLFFAAIVSPEARESRSSLQETWKKFSAALVRQDAQTLEALSTSCIRCSGCLTNTDKEYRDIELFKQEHPGNWADSIYSHWSFIPVSTFISEDIPLILDGPDREALIIDSLHFFVDNNDHNAKLYEYPCIASAEGSGKYRFSEVIINAPGKGRQGFSMAFAFIKTPEGYKFCGYSTIP